MVKILQFILCHEKRVLAISLYFTVFEMIFKKGHIFMPDKKLRRIDLQLEVQKCLQNIMHKVRNIACKTC